MVGTYYYINIMRGTHTLEPYVRAGFKPDAAEEFSSFFLVLIPFSHKRARISNSMTVILPGYHVHGGGSPRVFRAGPLAWPSPSGPLGWQRSPGSTARRRRVPHSGMRSTVEAGVASPDNARRSGPLAVTFSRSRRSRHDADGLVVILAGTPAGYGGDRGGRSLGKPSAAAAAP
jgi:hypothetical protein